MSCAAGREAAADLGLELRDLVEVELHRGLAAEDRDRPRVLLLGVDLGDRGRHGGEGAVDDGDGLALGEVDHDVHVGAGTLGGGLVLGLLLRREQPLDDLVERERAGTVGAVGPATKPVTPGVLRTTE